jgi:hypothetical protein
MKLIFYETSIALIMLSLMMACNSKKDEPNAEKNGIQTPFNSEKWIQKDGRDYPCRNELLNSILYTDTIRNQKKDQVIKLMGPPGRVNEEYFYYTIEQQRLGFWPVHTKTMVIRFSENDSVDWIKVHE